MLKFTSLTEFHVGRLNYVEPANSNLVDKVDEANVDTSSLVESSSQWIRALEA